MGVDIVSKMRPHAAPSMARTVGVALIATAGFLALAALAFFAALIGLVVAVFALVLRFRPRRRQATDGVVLEGRRTAAGWVVESAGSAR